MKTLLISEKTVKKVLSIEEVLNSVESAFKMKEAGETAALTSRIFADEGTEKWCYYNTARAWTKVGYSDAAFKNLHQAIAKGWSDMEYLKNDDALKSLHQDERWEALLYS